MAQTKRPGEAVTSLWPGEIRELLETPDYLLNWERRKVGRTLYQLPMGKKGEVWFRQQPAGMLQLALRVLEIDGYQFCLIPRRRSGGWTVPHGAGWFLLFVGPDWPCVLFAREGRIRGPIWER